MNVLGAVEVYSAFSFNQLGIFSNMIRWNYNARSMAGSWKCAWLLGTHRLGLSGIHAKHRPVRLRQPNNMAWLKHAFVDLFSFRRLTLEYWNGKHWELIYPSEKVNWLLMGKFREDALQITHPRARTVATNRTAEEEETLGTTAVAFSSTSPRGCAGMYPPPPPSRPRETTRGSVFSLTTQCIRCWKGCSSDSEPQSGRQSWYSKIGKCSSVYKCTEYHTKRSPII